MAKTLRDSKLENRTSRVKLQVKKEPHWKSIGQGLHLGYYKGVASASWQVRYRNIQKRYIYKTLGLADDVIDADGTKVLSFFQAQELARKWAVQQLKIEQGSEKYNGNLKVNDILDNYLEWFKHERKSYKETLSVIEAHIRPVFGEMFVSALTSDKINKWKNKLASTAGRKRSGMGTEQQYLEYDEKDRDAQRKRRSTANRILTVLKAALNKSFEDGHVDSDVQWKRVKPFKAVDHPKIRWLETDECIRLINAAEKEFKPIIKAALLTGCRYSEITSLKVSDFDSRFKTILVSVSKAGKPRGIALNDEGVEFFKAQTLGKSGNDIIFLKNNGAKWGKSHQDRPMYDACEIAKITPRASFHILRHAYASQLAMKGTGMSVIAKQLGNSVKICEKHYAHLSPNYIASEIEARMPKFGLIEKGNIKKLELG